MSTPFEWKALLERVNDPATWPWFMRIVVAGLIVALSYKAITAVVVGDYSGAVGLTAFDALMVVNLLRQLHCGGTP